MGRVSIQNINTFIESFNRVCQPLSTADSDLDVTGRFFLKERLEFGQFLVSLFVAHVGAEDNHGFIAESEKKKTDEDKVR